MHSSAYGNTRFIVIVFIIVMRRGGILFPDLPYSRCCCVNTYIYFFFTSGGIHETVSIGTRAFQQKERIERVFCVFLVCIYIDFAALNRYKLHVSYLYLYFNDNISTACPSVWIRVSVYLFVCMCNVLCKCTCLATGVRVSLSGVQQQISTGCLQSNVEKRNNQQRGVQYYTIGTCSNFIHNNNNQ